MNQQHTLFHLTQSMNIPGFYVSNVSSDCDCFSIFLQRRNHCARCSSCGKYCGRFYDSKFRYIRDLDWGWRVVFLCVKAVRVQCPHCGIQTERLPFSLFRSSFTKRFGFYVSHLCQMMTRADVAEFIGISEDTVGRIEWEHLNSQWKERKGWSEVHRFRMDEIASKKGHNYMTVISDIDSGTVIEVIEGRTLVALSACFETISLRYRKKVVCACIDMSRSYRAAISKWFPKAKIVFDRFHIVKHLNEALDDVRKLFKRKSKSTEVGKWKHTQRALGKNPENLTKQQLEALMWIRKEKPDLFMVYQMKESFRKLWEYPTKRGAEIFLTRWIKKMKNLGYNDMIKFCKMVERHREGILNYYLERVTNGPQEGFNNKLNVLRRKAYGYRNMDWFSLKIYQASVPKYDAHT